MVGIMFWLGLVILYYILSTVLFPRWSRRSGQGKWSWYMCNTMQTRWLWFLDMKELVMVLLSILARCLRNQFAIIFSLVLLKFLETRLSILDPVFWIYSTLEYSNLHVYLLNFPGQREGRNPQGLHFVLCKHRVLEQDFHILWKDRLLLCLVFWIPPWR